MKKYNTCIVYDHGTLVSVALRLSRDFEKVFYYNPWKKDYNKASDLCIGEGFDEIEWVENFWDVVNENAGAIDVVIFTGILDSDVQKQLVRMSIPVWGSRGAEAMEIYRWDVLQTQKQLGMPTPASVQVKGIDELREWLYNASGATYYIKCDANERGNIETFCYMNDYEACELSIMMPLEKELGSAANTCTFIIQEAVDSVKEDGYDGFIVDGKYPGVCMYGIEAKDAAYAGCVKLYKELPDGVRYVNENLAPEIEKYGMRGQFSTEIRETAAGEAYLLDLTMRFPYPPSNCVNDNWLNMATCVVEGAKGILIDPEYEFEYVCELILYSDYAKDNDYKLMVPQGIAEFVHQPYCYKSPDTKSIIVIAQSIGNTNVGSVVSRAKTLDEAKELCIERAGMLSGYGLKYDAGALEDACRTLIG